MSDWAQVLAAAISAVAVIVCEIIRRRPPILPDPETSATEAKRKARWKLARNICLIVFAFFVVIAIWFALPSKWGAHVVGIRIKIRQVPHADRAGGPQRMEPIAGEVSGVTPSEFRVVIYAQTDHWYVQPFIWSHNSSPITGINYDGTWNNETHLGARYAALLVEPSFVPQEVVESLPSIGGGVIALTSEEGK